MSPHDFKSIVDRATKATPSPQIKTRTNEPVRGAGYRVQSNVIVDAAGNKPGTVAGFSSWNDADFYTHAREDVLTLGNEIDGLRSALSLIVRRNRGQSFCPGACIVTDGLYAQANLPSNQWCSECIAFAALNDIPLRIQKYSVGVWYGPRGYPVFDVYTDAASELTDEESDEICAAFWRLDHIDVDQTKVTTEPICLASTRADAVRLPEDIAREWMRETYDFSHRDPTQADAL